MQETIQEHFLELKGFTPSAPSIMNDNKSTSCEISENWSQREKLISFQT